MNCHFVHTHLLFYLDQEISPGEKEGLETHLGQCSSCKSLMEKIKPVYEQAGEPVSPSDGFFERLSSLPPGEKYPVRHSLHFISFVRRIAAVILFMLASTSLTLLYTSGQKQPTQYAGEEPFFERYFHELDEELADNDYYFLTATH